MPSGPLGSIVSGPEHARWLLPSSGTFSHDEDRQRENKHKEDVARVDLARPLAHRVRHGTGSAGTSKGVRRPAG